MPRYRQRVRSAPLALGRPVWEDDPHFNLAYHLCHTSLPPPGDDAQLCRLMARLMSQPLDRNRPLWETWIVDGLPERALGSHHQGPPLHGRRHLRRGATQRAARDRTRRAVARAAAVGTGTPRPPERLSCSTPGKVWPPTSRPRPVACRRRCATRSEQPAPRAEPARALGGSGSILPARRHSRSRARSGPTGPGRIPRRASTISGRSGTRSAAH